MFAKYHDFSFTCIYLSCHFEQYTSTMRNALFNPVLDLLSLRVSSAYINVLIFVEDSPIG